LDLACGWGRERCEARRLRTRVSELGVFSGVRGAGGLFA